jgi:hypothetical protein
MAIATSVVVHPSPSLRLALAGMSALAGCIAASLVPIQFSVQTNALDSLAALICATLSLAGFFKTFRSTKTFHIDISGIGQIRLTQYSGVSTFACSSKPLLDETGTASVQLQSDSTLWPDLLVLHFRTEDGLSITVPVLADSVQGEGFHELSVACRWIAARADVDVASGKQ